MRRLAAIFLPLLAALAGVGPARADDLLQRLRDSTIGASAPAPKKADKPDPKRIINDSKSLLKEREPEMTAEEYALYEKISLLLNSQPEFGVKLLEAMMTDKEQPSPAFEFMLGNAYYSSGQLDKAEVRFRSAVKRYPSFIRAWDNLGVLYYASDRYAEAAPCFSQAITLGDHEATTFGLLGFSLERTGNIVAAEMAYMQGLAGDPENIDWLEGLLRIYIQGRQFARAEPLVRSLIKVRPAENRYWMAYATVLMEQGRRMEAAVVLETAAATGHGNSESLALLGDLYAEQGLYPEAAASYQRLLAESPDLGEKRLLHFAMVLIQAEKLTEADAVLDRVRRSLSPAGQVDYLLSRSEIQVARKQWPEAAATLQELLRADPLNGVALLSLGRVYLAQGDVIHAGFQFDAALQVPDATYRACLELANLEVKGHHYDKAIGLLQRALTLQRTDAVQDFLVRVKVLAGREG